MDPEGSSVHDVYDVGPLLGRGGFAVVHSARHRSTGARVALKIIETGRLNEVERKRMQREIDVHTSLSLENHPNIVKILGRFADSERVYLVVEHCPQGDLYKFLRNNGPVTERQARDFVLQLLNGLSFLHARNIVHRFASKYF